ncbi:MAG: efflux RND transporter permease subunit, partial [Candidatus Omnitrophica bacterium]|nr:efflux RND transporter permease subunit [Candidatus Omnitrophota bacterium]
MSAIETPRPPDPRDLSLIDRFIRFCMDNPLIVFLMIVLLLGWGLYVMPFEWDSKGFPTNPVPVDAIPNIGENQQIVFTDWEGRSPQDVEDQITYPLTVAMLGVPGVKEVRSFSMFGFSSVNVIFKDDIEFYWSRARILERLSTVQNELPVGVVPTMGPDATGLGQVFWYTLEGREWGLDELRSIQDWTVRYALQSSDGVSEIASVGGHVKEYQVDVDPDAMRAYRVTLDEVAQAVRRSNIDVGARTIELNQVEYIVRGIGYIKSVEDLENTVIKENDNVPIYIRNVAKASLGPALRRGVLDKEGAEVVGGVVVVRYGENPLQVIRNVKGTLDRIGEHEVVDGKDTWVLRGYEKKLDDGTVSRIRLVPFYDRTELIRETLDTLREALKEEVLTSILIVVIMLSHFMSSVMLCSLLPLTILISFILMRVFNVDANIMSLAGIAIAIGEMVDMGIIFCENIISRVEKEKSHEDPKETVFASASEVGSAIVTAMSTTVISFLPVFTMIGAEGKLFKPLAYTKTFCLVASLIVAIALVPALTLLIVRRRRRSLKVRVFHAALTLGVGAWLASSLNFWLGLLVMGMGLYRLIETGLVGWWRKGTHFFFNAAAVGVVTFILTNSWMPLGHGPGFTKNLIIVLVIYGTVIGALVLFQAAYPYVLRFFLRHKLTFYMVPGSILLFGLTVWLGFDRTFGMVPHLMDRVGLKGDSLRATPLWVAGVHEFPGLGKEFMPHLDEGSYLYMPTTMPHAGVGESMDALAKQDKLIAQIPEVDSVVGKIGRVDSPLDPAPISMVETVINYKPEF